MTIGQKVRKKRISRNYTQQELAENVGISKMMIWSIENDRKLPSFKTAIRLAKALNCKIDDFAAN